MLEPGEAPPLDRLLAAVISPDGDPARPEALLFLPGAGSSRRRVLGARDLAPEIVSRWEGSEPAGDPVAALTAAARDAGLQLSVLDGGGKGAAGWLASREAPSVRTLRLLERTLELAAWIAGERRHLASMVEARTAEIERTRHELQGVDPETGLTNRRDFDRAYDREWRRAARLRRPLAIVLVALGGGVTRPLAGRIASVPSRATDLVARFEPRTLAILLPDTDSSDAEVLGRRLLDALEGERISLGIGGVTPRVGFLESRDLVRIAREALDVAETDGPGSLEVRTIDDVALMTARRDASGGGQVH